MNKIVFRLRWVARIWSAVVIGFILLMLVGYAWNWVTTGTADPYAVEGYPPIENLPPLFMFLSVIGLGIAWRWEGLGGVITIVFQLATLLLLLIYWPITHDPRPYFPLMMIAIPGILFIVCWWQSRSRELCKNVPNKIKNTQRKTQRKW